MKFIAFVSLVCSSVRRSRRRHSFHIHSSPAYRFCEMKRIRLILVSSPPIFFTKQHQQFKRTWPSQIDSNQSNTNKPFFITSNFMLFSGTKSSPFLFHESSLEYLIDETGRQTKLFYHYSCIFCWLELTDDLSHRWLTILVTFYDNCLGRLTVLIFNINFEEYWKKMFSENYLWFC